MGHLPALQGDAHNSLKSADSLTRKGKERKQRSQVDIKIEHVDLIRDDFWLTKPWLLMGKTR